MTFIKSWEDFERAAEKLYLANPMKVSFGTSLQSGLVHLEYYFMFAKPDSTKIFCRNILALPMLNNVTNIYRRNCLIFALMNFYEHM